MLSRKMDKLLELLEPVRRQLFYQQLTARIVQYLIYGLVAGGLLLAAARLFPMTIFYKEAALILLVLTVMGGILYAFLHKPTYRVAAAYADRQGLNERVTTALAHMDHASSIVLMQREDAENRLQRALPHILENMKIWSVGKKQLTLLICLPLLWTVLIFVTNPMDQLLQQRAQQAQATEKVNKQLEEAEQQVKANEQLSQEQKQKMAEMLAKLKQDLKAMKEPLEQANALKEMEKNLQKMQEKEQQIQEALKQMQQRLAQEAMTQAIAAALQKQNQAALEEALKKMEQELAALPKEKQQELAKSLLEAANQMAQAAKAVDSKEAAEIAKQMQQAATALQSGQLAASIEQLQNSLQQALMQSAQSQIAAAQLAQSMQGLVQSQMVLAAGQPTLGMASASQPGNSQIATLGTVAQVANGNTANQGGNSQAGQAGQGAGNANGQGTGSGNGSGNGSGSGTGGGSGSGGSGTGQGNGAGLGAGSHELITVPTKRIDGKGGPTETVGGPLGEGASETRNSGTTQVSTGIARPYKEVYQQYEQLSRESLERGNIPSDYKEMVRDYFRSIEP